MKKSIKNRLKIVLTTLTCTSILVCMFATYFYSNYQLKEHILANEQAKIELIASEMDDIATDVQQIGILLAFHDDVQRYLLEDDISVSEKIALQELLRSELKRYILQRDYIVNFVLMNEERMLVSNSQHGIYVNEYDYRDLLEQNEYQKLSANEIKFQYGPTYQIPLHAQTMSGEDSIMAFPYVISVADKNNVRKTIGKIWVNVGFEYMYFRIENGLHDTDDFLFYDSHNEKIFQMKDYISDDAQKELSDYIRGENKEKDKAVIYKVSGGYCVFCQSSQSGWTVSSYIDAKTIRNQSKGLLIVYLLVTFLFILVIISVSKKIAESITRPIIALTDTVQEIAEGNTDSRVSITTEDEIGILAERFNRMVTKLNESYEKNLMLEKERRTIELDLLSAQINPHFIYNTLQTIIYLAAKNDNETIVKLVRSFVELLQNTVKISDKRVEVLLKEEVKTVKEYISVQNYRYKGKFTVVWDISPETENCLVPKTSIQPIVENSILHGVFNRENGVIKVKTYCEDSILYLVVEDNGVGMDDLQISRLLYDSSARKDSMRTIGIPNVMNRIHYLYGEDYGITIESELEQYTKITMRIPKKADLYTK